MMKYYIRMIMRVAALSTCLLGTLLALPGCDRQYGNVPDQIGLDPHASGNNQCGMYNEALGKPFRVTVLGPTVPGILGGKGERHPATGATVTFTVENSESGATFVESGASSSSSITDVAGHASATLRLGTKPGDVLVKASVETSKGAKSTEFRAVAGVQAIGKDLEGPVGGVIPEFGLILTEPDGSPAVGIPVYFRVEGNGHKASVGGQQLVQVVTDSDGRAVTSWKLGEAIAQYFVSAEILDLRPDGFRARAIEFEAMALDNWAMTVQLFGGLAVFILGMKWMSDGLKRMADRRLKAILQAVTRNRFMAVLVGTLITAVIQSSSATTVMVVGFVNAGLMTLTQAIGVVFGANIGTTVTAQIIAFKLDALAYPAIAAGLIMVSLTRRPWQRSLGEAILGFGLLFLGMTTMSDILKPLRYSPGFQSWFQLFDCTPVPGGFVQPGPALMCILIGTVTTCVIQSSSATVGLVLALCGQGLLSFYTAVPLVLGDNIGTTITAILASLGANRNAKRAAVAHSLFNIFGAAYMYILLFIPLWDGQPFFLGLVNWLTAGNVFADPPENLVRHVANAHTFFNVLNVLLFLPFVGLMAKACKMIVPVTIADKEQILQYLEPHLLQSPSLALQQAVKEVAYMVQRSQKSVNEGCAFFYDGGQGLAENITAREELIDRLQQEITGYLVQISRKDLTPDESALLPALIHAVNDAERIGDHSENLLELTRLKREGNLSISDHAMDDVKRLQSIVNEQFDAVMKSLTEQDANQVNIVIQKEQQITDLMRQASEEHVKRLETGECSVQSGVIFLDFLSQLERVGDRLTNIAERAGSIIQVIRG